MSWQSNHGIVSKWLFRYTADVLCCSSFSYFYVCNDFVIIVVINIVVIIDLLRLYVLFPEFRKGNVCFCRFYIQNILLHLCPLVKVVVLELHHWRIEWIAYFSLNSLLTFFIVLLWILLLLLFVLCIGSLSLFVFICSLLLSI